MSCARIDDDEHRRSDNPYYSPYGDADDDTEDFPDDEYEVSNFDQEVVLNNRRYPSDEDETPSDGTSLGTPLAASPPKSYGKYAERRISNELDRSSSTHHGTAV